MGIFNSTGSLTQMIAPLIGGYIISSFYPGVLGLVSGVFVFLALMYEIFIF